MNPEAPDRAVIGVILVLNRAYEALLGRGLTVDELESMLATSPGANESLRTLIVFLKRLTKGDLVGAYDMLLEDDQAASIFEAVVRLDEEIPKISRGWARWMLDWADYSAANLMYVDALYITLDALRGLLSTTTGVHLTGLDTLLLLQHIPNLQEAPISEAVKGLYDPLLCFPRSACPPMVPPSIEDQRRLYNILRDTADKAMGIEQSQDVLQQVYYSKVEKPRLKALAESVIGQLPALEIVLRPEDLPLSPGTSYAIYDNTNPAISKAIDSENVISIPAFKHRGAGLEDLWLAGREKKVLALTRESLLTAPLYTILTAVRLIAKTLTEGAKTCVCMSKSDGLVVNIPGLLTGDVEIPLSMVRSDFKVKLQKALVRADSVEKINGAIIEAFLSAAVEARFSS
ncbi:MAG: hypothetical protein F7C35_06120 [Desulfurococcales archaeon]|nr:hypothetical protein [Desulfurococcales archaeon]